MKTLGLRHIRIVILCMMLPLLPVHSQAPENYVISLWTFDGSQRFQENEPIVADHNQPIESGLMRMIGGEIDSSGESGTRWVEFTCGLVFESTNALRWDEVRGGDDIRTEPPAQLEIAVSTVDWEDIMLFFYYRSARTKQFDVSYHLGDGDWKPVVEDVIIDDTGEWSNIAVELQNIEDIENRSLVVLRIHDFIDSFGERSFSMDNIAVMGRRISKPNDCPPTIQTITPFTDIGILLNDPSSQTFTGNNGFQFQVADDVTPIEDLTIMAITTDPNVINQLGLSPVDETNGIYQLDIGDPHGYSGVADIIVRVTDKNGNSVEEVIRYGVSDVTLSESAHYHQGTSQASAGVALNEETMIVANDANQHLNIYSRTQSGVALASFDVSDNLSLERAQNGSVRPVLIESASQVGNRQYWLGSHSNLGRGQSYSNSYRLFATEIAGQGADAQLSFIGSYDGLFSDLVTWAEAYDYRFQRAVNQNVRPSDKGGFKIEGFTIAPDGQTAYIGLRTPLVPRDDRTQALIVPLNDFHDWFNNGNPSNSPSFGEPITFNFGGLGIRGLECNSSGCAIVAGSIGDADQFSLYTWDGNPQSDPILRNVILDELRPESVILDANDTFASGAQIQLISDSNRIDWYNSGSRGDRLPINLQLFRSNLVTLD